MLNEHMERLGQFSENLEKRFVGIVKKQQRRYWANAVGILGIFISIMAVIITGLPKITTDPSLPFWDVVILNLGQLLPLAVVLFILILALRWVVK